MSRHEASGESRGFILDLAVASEFVAYCGFDVFSIMSL